MRNLYNSSLGPEICIYGVKSLRIALVPFKVVQKCPQEISPHVRAVVRSPLQGTQITVQKGNPVKVMDPAVGRYRIMAGHTVFRNINRQPVSFIEEAHTSVQAFRRHRPACCGLFRPYGPFLHIRLYRPLPGISYSHYIYFVP